MKKLYILFVSIIICVGCYIITEKGFDKNQELKSDYVYTIYENNTLEIFQKKVQNSSRISLNEFYPSWNKYANKIQKVIIREDIYPTSCYQWFYDCKNLREIVDIQKIHFDYCEDVERMFYNCEKLEKINLKNFNVSKCERLTEMFSGCKNLKTLDLSSFDTTNVKDMEFMFEKCEKLKEIKVSDKWQTKNCDTYGMFQKCGVNKVKSGH